MDGSDTSTSRGDYWEPFRVADHSRLAFARRPDGGTERAGDESALDELDEGARIFVSAWLARPATKPERPGEGLSWDAPGFEPP